MIDKKELQMIAELMEQLQGSMDHSEDDFNHRLGRKKPEVKSIEIEGVIPVDGEDKDEDMEEAEEMLGKDLDNDMEMGEDPEHAAAVLGAEAEDDMEMMSPEEKLKHRIMKMRG